MDKLTVAVLRQRVAEAFPQMTGLARYKKAELVALLQRADHCMDDSVAGVHLDNDMNSCYLDSILVALFHDRGSAVAKTLMAAPVAAKGGELQVLAEDIKVAIAAAIEGDSGKTCTRLRGLLARYQRAAKLPPMNWTHEQAEPMDFMAIFNHMFKVRHQVIAEVDAWGLNALGKKVTLARKYHEARRERRNFVDVVGLDVLLGAGSEDVRVKELYPRRRTDTQFEVGDEWRAGGKAWRRRIEKTTLVKAPYLVIHISRLMPGEKLKTRVIPEPKIKMVENDRSLYLRSAVIHWGGAGGGHYTCVYECGGVWYEFDDLQDNKRRRIGDWDALLKRAKFWEGVTDLIYT